MCVCVWVPARAHLKCNHVSMRNCQQNYRAGPEYREHSGALLLLCACVAPCVKAMTLLPDTRILSANSYNRHPSIAPSYCCVRCVRLSGTNTQSHTQRDIHQATPEPPPSLFVYIMKFLLYSLFRIYHHCPKMEHTRTGI